MNVFKRTVKISPILRICLTGLFIALVAVLQKVLAINYIPGLPFVRLSFGGPALIMFASVLLGPWCGLLVGAASDLLGYFIFDMSSFPWYPQITAIYALLGFGSYFVFNLIRKISSKRIALFIEGFAFLALFVAATLYLCLDNGFQTWIKIVVPICLFLLMGLLIVSILLISKNVKLNFSYNVYSISLFCFIMEVVVLLGFGSLMKAFAFGFDIYLLIFICQAIVMFFNIVIDTITMSLLFRVTKKYFRYE